MEEVLQIINLLSLKLQQKSVTLGKSASLIESVINTFESNRSNESWKNLWTNINDFFKANDVVVDKIVDSQIKGYIYSLYSITMYNT